jgi:hypothetical protein
MKFFYLSFFALIIFASDSIAASGDTIVVRSHNKVDQVWYSDYDRVAVFPSQEKSFTKIYIKYTLGCPSSGCSDWDYDVNIWLMKNTGKIDSNILRVDTISISPLVTKTIWNVFKVYDPFELGRYITPYGSYMNKRNQSYGSAGFDSNWTHTFIFDVTDYAPLLHDSVLIRNAYHGWSSGFKFSIDFVFVEGSPARKVLSIQNLYTSGGGYNNPEDFETNRMPARKIYIPQRADDAALKVTITGHGQDKTNGCGEFCNKFYFLKANGKQIDKARMWRDDCGLNAVKPQGGTWIFDRANWCPGDKVHPFFHNLKKQMVAGDSLLLDIDLDPTIATGNNAASYNASATVFVYAKPSFLVDAAVKDILAPSKTDEYKHWNPICDHPKIVLQNLGSQTLTFATIEYGVVGDKMRTISWKGSLKFMEQDTITLETPYWFQEGFDSSKNTFSARVMTPNHQLNDENPLNDVVFSTFSAPPRLGPFTILMRTNGYPEENKLTIINEKGAVVFELKDLKANTNYSQVINLPDGCYQLLLSDTGKDGLDFWYYGQIGETKRTGGYFRLMKQGGGIYTNPKGDFGTEFRYQFTIGNMNVPEEESVQEDLNIFPNPASGNFFVQIPQGNGFVSLIIYNTAGQLISKETNIPAEKDYWHKTSIEGLSPGLYIVEVKHPIKTIKKKIVVY